MDDSVNQSQPPSELGERLLRRHREPVGVVDTKHAQRFYERTADWVAQRFSLLDHWKHRYESDASGGPGGRELVLGRHRFQSSVPVVSEPAMSWSERPRPSPIAAPPSVSTLSRSAAFPAPATPAVPAISSSPAEQYRVRRPNSRTSRVDSSAVSSKMELVTSNTQTSFDQTGAPESSSVEPPSTEKADGVVATPLRVVESTRMSVVESAPLRVQRQPAKIDGAVSELKEPRPGPSPLPLRKQPEPESMQTTEPLRGQTLSPLVAVADVAESSSVTESTIASPVPETRPASGERQERLVTTEIRLTPGRPAAPVILRRTQTESSPPSPPPANNTAPELSRVNVTAIPLPRSHESPHSTPLPRSHELPPSTSSPSSLVPQQTTILPLRINRSAQATTENTMLQRTAGVALTSQPSAESIMREATSSEPVMRQASSAATGEETQAGSIDLDHLAEQVGRMLSKQLAVERERRGIKEWH